VFMRLRVKVRQLTANSPRVTVVMPVWNAARFLRVAMDSILRQSYDSFEFVVIDDGSSDGTKEVLREYTDPRVRLVHNDSHRGLVYCLNAGLSLAGGEYVARMDGDDVSYPERLSAQVRFLESERDVALVGTWANLVDDKGDVLREIRTPSSSREIRELLLNSNLFVHSSVMFRKRAVLEVGGYQRVRPDTDTAQDYHLWLRLADRYPLANLAEILMDYRIHADQVSMRRLPAQRRCANLARRLAAKRRAKHGDSVKSPTGLGLLERLRGGPGTLGGDYLFFCELYRTTERRDLALRLAARAVFRSPLSGQAWGRTGRELARRLLGSKGVNMLRAWVRR
jgi:glycosyltransferase involved in cell wall biosynthesis